MKKLIWKIRYTLRMKERTIDCSWTFCWEAAQCAIDNDPHWHTCGAKDSCDEELSCWTD